MSFDEEHLDDHHECRGEIHELQAKLAAAEALLLKGSRLWQMSQMRGNHRSCSCATCVALDGWAQEAERDTDAEPVGPSEVDEMRELLKSVSRDWERNERMTKYMNLEWDGTVVHPERISVNISRAWYERANACVEDAKDGQTS